MQFVKTVFVCLLPTQLFCLPIHHLTTTMVSKISSVALLLFFRCTWGTLSEGDEIVSISSKLVRRMTRVDCVKALKGKKIKLGGLIIFIRVNYFDHV